MGRIYISNNLGKVKQGVSGFKGGRIKRSEPQWKGNKQIKVKFVKSGLKKQGFCLVVTLISSYLLSFLILHF